MTSSDEATTPAFRDFGLPPALLQATDELGFEFSTEIQALTLPVIAAGRDVAAQAQTGTGKTAAFLLGSFSRLLTTEPGERSADQPRMLVIAPTRELAIQIGKDAESLGKYTELKTAVVYGGIDYEKQRAQVAGGIDVLIGTPGRLIDYFKQKVFNLKALEIVVLDEADRMFDLGFIADIRFLLRRMPPPGERTSMLFSATLSHRVMELAYEHMDKPEELKTETTQVTADGVRQSLYHPASDEKIPLLLGLIRDLQPPRSMIFVNTKRAAERIEGYLVGNGITCGLLSGDVRQNKRQRILSDFTGGNIPVLIATDVAARGLHIDDVSHVFNYDLPQNAEDYVHRIGRTARAGTDGVAVSFACENYSFSLPEIQDYIGQTIPLEPITDELLVEPKRPARIERDRVEKHGERKSSGRAAGRGSGPGGSTPGGRGGKRPSRNGRSQSGSRSGSRSGSAGESGSGSPAPKDGAAKVASPGSPVSSSTEGNTASADAPKKRRRRRRRGGKSAGASSSASSSDTSSQETGSGGNSDG
jgi:ATP-dependent RNA helicase RhlB